MGKANLEVGNGNFHMPYGISSAMALLFGDRIPEPGCFITAVCNQVGAVEGIFVAEYVWGHAERCSLSQAVNRQKLIF
jgi:hypothetical protein